MAEPYARRSGSDGGVLGRLVGARGRASAIREIEDLFARTERIRDVESDQVARIAEKHGVDLERRLRTARIGLYRRFFEHCLLDQSVSDEERADLAHLRGILRLENEDVARVHEEVACLIYGNAIDHVLEDQRLDPEEEEFLRKLRGELQLPDGMADRLYVEGEQRARWRFLDRAVRRDDFLLTGRDVVIELAGDSQESIEDAVSGAVQQGCLAVEGLGWVEVTHIGAEVSDGRIARWHVKLKAKREAEE